jgi:hypothetical protein
MIKFALGVYDTLEITIGHHPLYRRANRSLASEKWLAFERHKSFVSFPDHFGCPTNTRVQLNR